MTGISEVLGSIGYLVSNAKYAARDIKIKRLWVGIPHIVKEKGLNLLTYVKKIACR